MKTYYTGYVRGENGRSLGIIFNDGQAWLNQRQFSLQKLRGLGFGRNCLDSDILEEVDDVIDAILEKKSVTREDTFDIAIINVLWKMVASKRLGNYNWLV